jgi:LPXTG-site transpeptidase (sortase) family protein
MGLYNNLNYFLCQMIFNGLQLIKNMFDFFKITPKKRSVKVYKKYGILYNNPSKKKKVAFYLANLIIFISVIYFAYLYKPLIVSIVDFKFRSEEKIKIISQQTEKKVTEKKEEKIFEIIIPRIAARSDIIANISPYNPEAYLKILDQDKIAHSKISSLPGKGKNTMTYLFAHSTQQSLGMVRKNSIFYLLDKVRDNDFVYVIHGGNFYKYRVYLKKVISDRESEYLKFTDKEREILILQTCWPIGTNWKRLLIFAERI